MNPSIQLRTVLILSAASLAAGCATKPEIDPADLPPQALVDDGIDYYSSNPESSKLGSDDLGTNQLLSHNSDQWTTDEDGNRIYHLNQLRRGQASSYYIGDIRYIYATTNNGASNGNGYGSTPATISRSGWPTHSDSYRGSNANSYYQTRRGRITYLPNRNTNPAPTSTTQGNSTNTNNGGSTPATVTTPGSTSRPVTSSPPRAPRRSAPPVSRPERSPRSTDDSRRPDR